MTDSGQLGGERGRPIGAAASALVPGARCAKHAARAATGTCARCGDYLCGLCGLRVGERLHCQSCAARVTREHSARASAALVLGLLGACGLFVVAPAALTLAVLELQAIASGAAPIGGRGLARAALALGAAGVLMLLSAVLVWSLAR
jgi:hypothetical protein